VGLVGSPDCGLTLKKKHFEEEILQNYSLRLINPASETVEQRLPGEADIHSACQHILYGFEIWPDAFRGGHISLLTS
jgi:hypothetical protein